MTRENETIENVDEDTLSAKKARRAYLIKKTVLHIAGLALLALAWYLLRGVL